MPDLNLDFGDGVKTTPTTGDAPSGDTTDITGSTPKPGGEDITNKDGNTTPTEPTTPTTPIKPTNPSEPTTPSEPTDTNPSTGGLEAGTIVEFEGVEYTVAENGNIVDKDGNVFKEAKDVQSWLDENNSVDDNELEGASIKDIIDAVGIEVKDENGNDVEFSDNKDGLKSYFDSVIQLKTDEANKAALNKFFVDNPVVKQFVDYMIVNNGSPIGFGELPDRSSIEVDKDNEHQQEQIIRVAAAEFGNKGVTDAYIKYLKDSGGLYDEAVSQLQALIDKDNNVRQRIEAEAQNRRVAEEQAVRDYWKNVNDVIASRNIAGYKIPESFTKEVNGQKIALTPDDFYDYLYRAKEVDADGNRLTGYQRDLNKLTDEELLNRELLDAWLMFTGGTYKDLVQMAVKENEVRKLIVKSKQQRSTRTIKVKTPKDKGDINTIVYE